MSRRTGPVWEFTVGARSAMRDTSWGTVLDVNGDGYADVVGGEPGATSDRPGRVHVYMGSAAGLSSTPALSLTGPDGAGGRFGSSAASAGDVNGDGFADLIVGAYGAMSERGRVHVYMGSAAGLSSTPALSLTGPDGMGGRFGHSVASAGDVNGDGFADVIVGAPGPMSGTGKAYLFLGSAAGLSSSIALSITGPDMGGNFGNSVASAGDLNGDGFADVIVGAPNTLSNTGRVHVYMGSAAGLSSTASLGITGPDGPNGNFGNSVASAGDVNGDGFADVIVGAPNASSGMARPGRVHVYFGSAAGLSSSPAISLTRSTTTVQWGWSVASAGDVNGDGFADVIVGAPDSHQADVYMGSATGLGSTPVSLSSMVFDWFGYSVASAGDINGDGFADVIIGAPGSHQIHVYMGNMTGLDTWDFYRSSPDGMPGYFGWSVASAENVISAPKGRTNTEQGA